MYLNALIKYIKIRKTKVTDGRILWTGSKCETITDGYRLDSGVTLTISLASRIDSAMISFCHLRVWNRQ